MSKSSFPLQPAPGVVARTDDGRGNFLVNVTSNVAYMALSMGVMLWYVPFLINHLGVAAYGVVPLANSLILYFAPATDGLNVAVNRYLTIDLNRGDRDAANRTFNTAFFTAVLAMAALLPLTLIMVWQFAVVFETPAGLENETRFLFAGVMLTFLLAIVGATFEVSSIALHRFDLRNLVRGLALLTRVAVPALLFWWLGARLWHVGLGYGLSAAVGLVGAWWLWRKLTPQLQVRFAAFDRSRLRALLGLSGWSVVNRIGLLLFLSVDLAIVNLYLGAQATGEYGTLILFPELIRNLTDTVSSVLNPAITARYALGDWEGLRTLATRSVKLLGLVLALPIGLACGFAQPFLTLWLGPEFARLDLLLIVLVGHLSVTLATLPLSYVLTSYNKVKIQGIVTLILGVVNVMLGIYLAVGANLGALGVALATAIVYTVRNLFFLSSYSAATMNCPPWTFYLTLTAGAAATLLTGLAAWALQQFWPVESWPHLIVCALALSIAYLGLVYRVVLNREDRRLLVALVPSRMARWSD
jgi:membrane protein EpsK